MMELEVWQWGLAILGSVLIGFTKAGLPGAGILTIAIYAMVFDAKESVGIVLPILIIANTNALFLYRKVADWKLVAKLLPSMLLGIIGGFYLLDHIDSKALQPIIGGVLLALTGVHFFRIWQEKREVQFLKGPWSPVVIGLISGVSTMVANAGGTLTVIYLMALRLEKFLLIGTMVWLYFIINFIKGYFHYEIGLITWETLKLSLFLGAFSIIGTFLGPLVMRYVPQKIFNALIWVFVILASAQLLLR